MDIIRMWCDRPTDYLLDYPLLTTIGRMAGMSDEDIRAMNEKASGDPELLAKLYFEDNAIE
jgi:hypothetical protein